MPRKVERSRDEEQARLIKQQARDDRSRQVWPKGKGAGWEDPGMIADPKAFDVAGWIDCWDHWRAMGG